MLLLASFLEEEKDVFIVALGIGQKPIQRLRFDMCHELGHIILHSLEDSEDELHRDRFNLVEKQAQLFHEALAHSAHFQLDLFRDSIVLLPHPQFSLYRYIKRSNKKINNFDFFLKILLS